MSLLMVSFLLTGISFHILAPLKAIDFCVKLNSYISRNTFAETADLRVMFGIMFGVVCTKQLACDV